MIAEARQRAERQNIPASFAVGDAQALPYPDGEFDASYAERLLMHVPDVERVLAEMVRVTRSGGRLAAFDFDWDTMIVDSPQRETTRTIVRTFSDSHRHGWIGRQLPRRFREHGLTEVSVDAVPVFVSYDFAGLLLGGHSAGLQAEGTLTAEELEAWWSDLQGAHERGTFLLGFMAIVVAGTK
jgi:SAM-dependent methyltransferase